MHMVAFATLTAFGVYTFPRVRPFILAALLSAYGALIELIQMTPIVNRDGDFRDWMVDSAGIIFALTVIYVSRRRILHDGLYGRP